MVWFHLMFMQFEYELDAWRFIIGVYNTFKDKILSNIIEIIKKKLHRHVNQIKLSILATPFIILVKDSKKRSTQLRYGLMSFNYQLTLFAMFGPQPWKGYDSLQMLKLFLFTQLLFIRIVDCIVFVGHCTCVLHHLFTYCIDLKKNLRKKYYFEMKYV